MTNPYRLNLTPRSVRSRIAPILLIVLLAGACQTASPAAPTFPPVLIGPSATAAVPTTAPILQTPTTATRSQPGPWLVYRKAKPDELGILYPDGSGLTTAAAQACKSGPSLPITPDPLNRTAIISGNVYLIQPGSGLRTLLYSPGVQCFSAYTGDAAAGLLARVERATSTAMPSLVIYELPQGVVRFKTPLVKCPIQIQCDFSESKGWDLQWSPSGRYLAFPAMWYGASTDLFVYDSHDGTTRQLTNGPDNVAQLAWSPDGRTILMGELLAASGQVYPFTTSMWAVSVSTNEINQIYALDRPMPQTLLGWVDKQKFVIYDGTSVANNLGLGSTKLRMIDLATGKTQLVFDGTFSMAQLDPASGSIVLFGKHNGTQYQTGTYLLSIGAFTVKYLGAFTSTWDEDAQLFVTNASCNNDPQAFQAFDFSGKMQCIPMPTRLQRYPSPDGQWAVSLQDGSISLQAKDGSLLPISKQAGTQVIWCPDSSGFFFVSRQVLYHVALPDGTLQSIDQLLHTDKLGFQWLQ